MIARWGSRIEMGDFNGTFRGRVGDCCIVETWAEGLEGTFQDWQERWQVLLSIYFGLSFGLVQQWCHLLGEILSSCLKNNIFGRCSLFLWKIIYCAVVFSLPWAASHWVWQWKPILKSILRCCWEMHSCLHVVLVVFDPVEARDLLSIQTESESSAPEPVGGQNFPIASPGASILSFLLTLFSSLIFA